jgi:hypothetical protein
MGTMDHLCEASPGDIAADGRVVRQAAPPVPAPPRPVHVGRAFLQGFDPAGQPLVSSSPDAPGPAGAARTTVALQQDAIGAEVLLVWEPDPAALPIIVGIVQPLASQPTGAAAPERVTVRADAREYVISAEREIVLQCGEASITLTRAGKVIIKGNYVVSRSAGCNKIKGAAVEIN